MVAMTGVTKTILMTVNAQLAESYQVSYTAVAALTGVPLILSAFTGLICLVAARVCGKRPLYLASLLLVFIGTTWNTNVASSYAQCMAARVFQGLGWGAFDTLILGSIQDTYFVSPERPHASSPSSTKPNQEHERGLRIAIYSIVAVATTWGAPLIGGVASQSQVGFSLQFTILSAFFVVAVPAIALGAPETVFDRAYTLAQTPATAASSKYKASLPITPRRIFSLETFNDYIIKLKPYSYSGPYDLSTLLQAPRAFVTPTTTLLAVASLLPHSALWGLAASLSLLFRPLPFNLPPSSIGALLIAPFLLTTAVVAASSLLPRFLQKTAGTTTNPLVPTKRIPFLNLPLPQCTLTAVSLRFTPKTHVWTIALGSLLTFIGILTFGLHITSALTPRPDEDPVLAATTSVYALGYLAPRVNLPAVSFVLGLLAAGAYALDAAVRPAVAASTAFTSSNLGVALRNTADMSAGVACWRTLFAGVFVLVLPGAVWASRDGLKEVCIGIGIAQMVVGAVLGMVWWLWGEGLVRRWDGRVMKLVNLEMLRRNGSFFDMD